MIKMMDIAKMIKMKSKNKFIWKKGLGANELISYEEQIPKKIEFVKNPVREMKKLGVKFAFINVTQHPDI